MKGKTKKLFKFIRTVSLPAIGKFVVAKKFREGETVDDIKFAWTLGNYFKANFLKKVEPAVPKIKLRERQLIVRARDSAIITKLGGKKQVETTLGQFWEFLKTADQTRRYRRYIRDEEGVLWVVFGRWCDAGLYIGVLSFDDDPHVCGVGERFLSR